MRSIIASRTLTTWLTAPSGMASSARRALATEAAADTARSRDVAISSTSRAEDRAARRVGRLRLPDLDEPAPDREAFADGAQEVPGRRDDEVGSDDGWCGRREHATERDEWVAREEALETVQAFPGGAEVGVECVDRAPVDLHPGLPDPVDHGLEVCPQRARVVDGGQIAEGRQHGTRGEEDERHRGGDEHGSPAEASRHAPGVGRGLGGHVAGTAMTMKRGAVGWYEVDVWSVSCSVAVGSRYSTAFHGPSAGPWSPRTCAWSHRRARARSRRLCAPSRAR